MKDNEMFRKLRMRLQAFYVNQEKIRWCGLTDDQKRVIFESGFTMEYRVELPKSLRNLIIQIVSQKNMALKLRQLR